jgi:uncharacterized protein
MKEFILSILIAWTFVNTLKPVLTWIKEKKISFKTMFTNGGMPSGHTVLVVSLASALYLEEGLSPVFVIGVVFALLIIYDALKVRTIIGQQSQIINRLMEKEPGFEKLDEQVGHKTSEVVASIILGIVIPILVYGIL